MYTNIIVCNAEMCYLPLLFTKSACSKQSQVNFFCEMFLFSKEKKTLSPSPGGRKQAKNCQFSMYGLIKAEEYVK